MAKRSLHALDYLKKIDRHPAAPVCVVFGDELFLKREVIAQLERSVLGEGDGEFSRTVVAGRQAEPREVFDALGTVALFGGNQRLVEIDDADDFVTRSRAALEDYVARPHSSGVLLLDVKSWPSNTRLYKRLADTGLVIDCTRPTDARILKWLGERAQKQHAAVLDPVAAEVLIESVEPDLGLLDGELAKLALLAGPGETISLELVHSAVGGWRTQSTWNLIDTATEGNARAALEQLHRLLAAGENPIALLGQIASTLRRFAATTSLVEEAERTGRRVSLAVALEQAGFRKFVIGKAERQLKQLGRQRGARLSRWLLDADLALKGASSAPARARLVLEALIVRLSSAADPRRMPAQS